MKKILICLLLFFALVFTVNAEEIKSFDSRVKINKDGTIDVKETIEYDFGELDRHGIFRNIPYIKTNKDGKKFKLDFSNFSVTDENNFAYKYSRSTVDESIKLKIGDPDRTISGIHTYIIQYKVRGALTYYSDHDELYWNATGNDWEVPITQSTAQVVWPQEIQESEIKVACYTGITGSTETACNFFHDRDKVGISSTRELSSGEGLTVVVGFPIDIVTRLEPKEIISFWDTFIGKLVGLLLGLLALSWYVFLPFFIVYKWWSGGRDPKGTTGVTTAWYNPPKTSEGKRFLTPGEVGALGDETVDLKDISATIIDLARRGYLKIEERKKGDFWLIKLDSQKADSGPLQGKQARMTSFWQVPLSGTRPESLLEYEKLLLDKFFKSKKEIRLKDEYLYEEVEKIKTSLYEQIVAGGLFPKNPQSIRTGYYVLAGIALFTFNLFLAFITFVFGRVMPRKTIEGVNAFNEAKSLKNFLTSQERQLKFQADKQMMFERLLPFAVAFGVEKIWARRFEDLNLKQPDWYQGYSSGYFNSYLFVNSLNSSMKSFRSAATPTRSSSGFSSGFSGGSSGGGGGGGGGGSW